MNAPEPYTLPKAIPWIPGESVLGLLVRNAQPHGYPDPRRLLKRTFPDARELSALGARDLSEHERDAFSCLLGMNRADFDLMHHGSSVPVTRNLFGHAVHESLVQLRYRPVCTLCLRESPHHRAVWSLNFFAVCPQHSAVLVQRCPKCNFALVWQTPSVATCSSRRCRYPLSCIDPVTVEPEMTRGLANIAGLLTGANCGITPPMTVNDTIRRVLDLGTLGIGLRGTRIFTKDAWVNPVKTMQIVNAGWAALADWPHGFRALIDSLRLLSPGRSGRYGIRKEFGSLSTWLNAKAGKPGTGHLIEEFNRYSSRLSALSTRAPSVLRYRATRGMDNEVINAAEAASIVALDHARLSKLADDHDLWVVAPTGSGAPSLLDARKFASVADRISRSLTKTDAAEILNVSKSAFLNFEERRLLVPTRPDLRILPERIYEAEDVSIMLAALEAAAEFRKRPPDCGKLLSANALARCGVTIAEIVQGVFAGTLRPFALDLGQRGVSRLLFKPVWVHHVLHPSRPMSVDHAAHVLGVKQEVAYHFVRRDILQGGPYISAEALSTFQAEYITGTEIAATHGLRARWVSVKLVGLGVEPVCAPQVDGCRQYLFRRADLETIDPADLVGPRGKLRLTVPNEDCDAD